jgi:diaminopropionate ammonia-lyase
MAGLDCATPSAVAWPVLRACLHGCITIGDDETAAARRELAGLALTIGACGAAPLAALRALHTDPRCGALREQLSVAASTSFLLVGSEGPTGDDVA